MKPTLVLLAFTVWITPILAGGSIVAKLDLKDFGYRFSGSTSAFADFSSLAFLSDDPVAVSINQKSFGSVEPLFTDIPDSTILIFDLKQNRVIKTVRMPVEKSWDSVLAISHERMAILNERGIQFCDLNFRCELLGPTRGPLLVSPEGKRIVVGGNAHTLQRVIDAQSLQQIAELARPSKAIQAVTHIPGDDGLLLVHMGNQTAVRRSGGQDVWLDLDDQGTFPEFRFLNRQLLTGLAHATDQAVIFDVNGKKLHSYDVAKAWQTGFLPTAAGTRFAIYEHGYTTWNEIFNFLDVDGGRPQNFQRVRIIDLSSGNEIYRLEWDPRPHLIKPALSPTGRRVARVKAGILEVFNVN